MEPQPPFALLRVSRLFRFFSSSRSDRTPGPATSHTADVMDTATKGGKNAIAKLEGRMRDLEMELSNCQMRTGETQKAYQKSERKIKELQFQNDEDQKNQEKMGELASKLQEKIRTYKKQIEEANTVASLPEHDSLAGSLQPLYVPTSTLDAWFDPEFPPQLGIAWR